MSGSSSHHALALIEGLRAFEAQRTPARCQALVTQAQAALEAGCAELFTQCESQLLRSPSQAHLLGTLRRLRAQATAVGALIDAPHAMRRTLAVAVRPQGSVRACAEDAAGEHRELGALIETLLGLQAGSVWTLPGLFDDEALAGLSDLDWYRLARHFARWSMHPAAALDALRVQLPAHGEPAPEQLAFVLLSLPAPAANPLDSRYLRAALDALAAHETALTLGQGVLACSARVLLGGHPRQLVHELLYALEHARLARAAQTARRMVGGDARALQAYIGPTAMGRVRVLFAAAITRESMLSVEYPRARHVQALARRAAALLAEAGIHDVRRFSEPAPFERVCQEAFARAYVLTKAAGPTRH